MNIELKLKIDVVEKDAQKSAIKQLENAINAIGDIEYQWLHAETWQAFHLLKRSLLKANNGEKS